MLLPGSSCTRERTHRSEIAGSLARRIVLAQRREGETAPSVASRCCSSASPGGRPPAAAPRRRRGPLAYGASGAGGIAHRIEAAAGRRASGAAGLIICTRLHAPWQFQLASPRDRSLTDGTRPTLTHARSSIHAAGPGWHAAAHARGVLLYSTYLARSS